MFDVLALKNKKKGMVDHLHGRHVYLRVRTIDASRVTKENKRLREELPRKYATSEKKAKGERISNLTTSVPFLFCQRLLHDPTNGCPRLGLLLMINPLLLS